MHLTEISSGSGVIPVYPTVVHLLDDAATQAPDALALVFGQHRLSYADYRHAVARLARRLIDLGSVGERVVTVLPNGINTCIATYGILAARAQCVPLNPLYTARELGEILEDARPSVLILDERFASTVSPLVEQAKIKQVLMVNETDQSLSDDREVQRAAGGSQSPVSPLPTPLPLPDDLAMLQYTGGTTGRAKGVNLTHYATSINVSQREGLLPTHSTGERIFCVMPLFHAYALAMGLHLACWCKGALIIHERFSPQDVLKTIEAEQITIFPGSPTLFTGVMGHEDFTRTDYSSIHTCYSGASPLAQDSLERWQRQVNAPVFEGYGQTEAGPILSFNPANARCKLNSVGIAVAHTEIQIVDTDTGTRVLCAGEVGEIRARGPQLMHSYRGLDDETNHALRDGWLYTGDIGELDEDGYLFIRDRLKDMILVGGYNVYPREVDDVLIAHPTVVDAACVGAPDSYRQEVVRAFVVTHNGSGDIDALTQHCRDNLAHYKRPVSIDCVDELPKTTVGKTDKTVLRQWTAQRYPV